MGGKKIGARTYVADDDVAVVVVVRAGAPAGKSTDDPYTNDDDAMRRTDRATFAIAARTSATAILAAHPSRVTMPRLTQRSTTNALTMVEYGAPT